MSVRYHKRVREVRGRERDDDDDAQGLCSTIPRDTSGFNAITNALP